ncbi:hypothetical protein LCGC14_0825790 [marine sediment metagenome]|uniref:Pectate lyase superfamily protein domain-containing protein n=1 Tax=marine sediment metagenome TaxID=412755 RepID=A0A0F9SQ24_9ZZZZ
MPRLSTRLQLPLGNYIGPKSPGVIKTIDAGVFQTADDRLMQSGAGRPNGIITSHWAGQRYLDTTNQTLWFNPLAGDQDNWVQLQRNTTFNVRDYGATGKPGDDDTVAVQDTINAATELLFGTIPAGIGSVIAVGQFEISSSLLIDNLAGFHLLGGGYFATRFKWVGPADEPMFLLTNAFRCAFKDFQVVAGNELLAGFLMVKDTGGSSLPPSSCFFEDVVIEGVSAGQGVTRGWDISEAGTAGSNNNEFHTFIHCAVKNYKESAWRIGHTNVKTIRFYGCRFDALSGVGEQGILVEKGSFHWHGGGGGGNQEADFYIADAPDVCSVIGGDFENSKRLLIGSGPTGAPGFITIQNTRWDSQHMHPDGKMIVWRLPSLVLIGNTFGGGGETTPTVITHSQGSREGFFTCIGNQFITTGSSDTEPWNVEDDTNCYIEGNFFRDTLQVPTTNSPIPDGETAPKLWANKFFYTGNTGATVITGFIGGNAQIGQPKTIVFKDIFTTIDFENGSLKGNAGVNWKPALNDHMTCVYDGTNWYCDISNNAGASYITGELVSYDNSAVFHNSEAVRV